MTFVEQIEVGDHNKRFDFVDVLKVIAIILVVVGHYSNDDSTRRFVYSFHIPLFFIISGFLYKKRSFVVELKRCCSSLLLPYFLYGILIVLALYVANKYTPCTIGHFISGDLDVINNALCPLWFLIALFNIRLVSSCMGGVNF